MSKTQQLGLGLVLFFFASLLGYASWQAFTQPGEAQGVLGGANATVDATFVTGSPQYGTQDVIGTHVGTSTLGVSWTTINVTNSYISDIGSAKQATYQLKVTAVTTTANSANFRVQGSNDNLCMTQVGSVNATTNTVMADINWYDAMNHLQGRVEPTSLTAGSSTIVMPWLNVAAGDTAEILLTNLNFRCLKFLASASSTQLYVGLNTRN